MSRLLLAFVLLLAVPAAQAIEHPAAAVVRRLQQELLAIDQRLALDDTAARRRATQELLLATHDLEYMARLCLGRHWTEIEEAQRRRFHDAFVALSVASYAGNFADRPQARFELLGTSELPRDRVQVRTRLIGRQGRPVALDYTLQPQDDGGWRIIDVRVEGVSDLAVRRVQYTSLLEREGFERLLEHVQTQTKFPVSPESAPTS